MLRESSPCTHSSATATSGGLQKHQHSAQPPSLEEPHTIFIPVVNSWEIWWGQLSCALYPSPFPHMQGFLIRKAAVPQTIGKVGNDLTEAAGNKVFRVQCRNLSCGAVNHLQLATVRKIGKEEEGDTATAYPKFMLDLLQHILIHWVGSCCCGPGFLHPFICCLLLLFFLFCCRECCSLCFHIRIIKIIQP